MIFGTIGYLLSGLPLKTAMQCGFSMAQIGEFSFILASLGITLGVTSDFLYPVVVAASIITTFLTPYMIKLSLPALQTLGKTAASEGDAPTFGSLNCRQRGAGFWLARDVYGATRYCRDLSRPNLFGDRYFLYGYSAFPARPADALGR